MAQDAYRALGALVDELRERDDRIRDLQQQLQLVHAEHDDIVLCFDRCEGARAEAVEARGIAEQAQRDADDRLAEAEAEIRRLRSRLRVSNSNEEVAQENYESARARADLAQQQRDLAVRHASLMVQVLAHQNRITQAEVDWSHDQTTLRLSRAHGAPAAQALSLPRSVPVTVQDNVRSNVITFWDGANSPLVDRLNDLLPYLQQYRLLGSYINGMADPPPMFGNNFLRSILNQSPHGRSRVVAAAPLAHLVREIRAGNRRAPSRRRGRWVPVPTHGGHIWLEILYTAPLPGTEGPGRQDHRFWLPGEASLMPSATSQSGIYDEYAKLYGPHPDDAAVWNAEQDDSDDDGDDGDDAGDDAMDE